MSGIGSRIGPPDEGQGRQVGARLPVGDVERAVAKAAAIDGVTLVRMPRVEWLNTHGHFALPEAAAPAIPLLQRAFDALGGREAEQRSKLFRLLPSDLIHVNSRTMIEVDEFQHFTSYRRLTLRDLPAGSELRPVYDRLCETWSLKADRYRASKVAKGFPGASSRARQRAYNDLLRDLVAPLMGYRLVRVPAPNISGDEAYRAASAALQGLRS